MKTNPRRISSGGLGGRSQRSVVFPSISLLERKVTNGRNPRIRERLRESLTMWLWAAAGWLTQFRLQHKFRGTTMALKLTSSLHHSNRDRKRKTYSCACQGHITHILSITPLSRVGLGHSLPLHSIIFLLSHHQRHARAQRVDHQLARQNIRSIGSP